jgi:hypothetical protein
VRTQRNPKPWSNDCGLALGGGGGLALGGIGGFEGYWCECMFEVEEDEGTKR